MANQDLPSILSLETSRRQQEAAGWMRSGSSAALNPCSPPLGEGERSKLLLHANSGTDFKRFRGLAGKTLQRALCSGCFSCLIKSGICCNPIQGNA